MQIRLLIIDNQQTTQESDDNNINSEYIEIRQRRVADTYEELDNNRSIIGFIGRSSCDLFNSCDIGIVINENASAIAKSMANVICLETEYPFKSIIESIKLSKRHQTKCGLRY